MTMPASQSVDGMPEYVTYWIESARYWRSIAGPQDTWRDAILWLAKHVRPLNTHSPDAGTKVTCIERLDVLLSSAPYLSDNDLFTLQSLVDQLLDLRTTMQGCGTRAIGVLCGHVWENGTVHLCDLCEFHLFESLTTLTHISQGEE